MRAFVLISACLAVAFSVANASAEAVDAKLGDTCGTVARVTCEEGLWCEPRPGSCGDSNAIGTCVRITKSCPRNIRPVCGCNRRTYSNDCVRQGGKMGLDYAGRCWTDLVK